MCCFPTKWGHLFLAHFVQGSPKDKCIFLVLSQQNTLFFPVFPTKTKVCTRFPTNRNVCPLKTLFGVFPTKERLPLRRFGFYDCPAIVRIRGGSDPGEKAGTLRDGPVVRIWRPVVRVEGEGAGSASRPLRPAIVRILRPVVSHDFREGGGSGASYDFTIAGQS